MPLFLDHLRTGARSLLRTPLASLSIVATLAICIGATTAVFSIVNAILVRGLPFRDPDRLVWVGSRTPDGSNGPLTLPEFMDFRQQSRTVELAAYAGLSANLATPDGVQRLQGMRISANAFDLLGASPSAGRLLQTPDDAIDAPRVAVVSYGFWQRQFAGKPGVVGSTLQINGEKYTVVGIMPRYFPMPLRNVDLYVPLSPDRDPRRNARRSTNFLRLFGRMTGSTAIGAGERELTALTKSLREQFPAEYGAKLGVSVRPLQDALVGDQRPTLVVLLTCVGLMLAIALANILNLLLIRATTRQGEIAVRRALGASHGQVAVQLLAEGGLLALAGSILGAGLASLALRLAVVRAGASVPRLDEARVDLPALVFAVGLGAIATALFSAIPMLIAMRTQPQAVLRAAARANVGTRGQARLRGAFIVAEIALALILTTATAALLESLVRLQRVELGFSTDSTFAGRVSLPAQRYATGADQARFQEAFHAALVARPGVVSAGAISVAPLAGALQTSNFAVVGNMPARREDWPNANWRAVTPDYFTTVRVKLLTGRTFTRQDTDSSSGVVMVNRSTAEKIFGGSAVGKEILIQDTGAEPRTATVVGVVADTRDVDLDGGVPTVVYLPMTQMPKSSAVFVAASQYWTVRVATDPAQFTASFLAALREVDREVATTGLGLMSQYVDRVLATRRFSVIVLLAFAVISLVLATIGVYGVMAYSVEQRRREIGVRLALGASPGSVVRFVLGNALTIAGVGVLIGVFGAVIAGRSMAGLLFGVAPGDPRILVGAGLLMLAASAIASWIPAARAARIDPLQALSA
jgi:putative ABC transport system permease protein